MKNGNGPSVKIEEKIKKRLDEYAENTGRRRKWVVSRAVEKYLDEVE